MNIKIRKEEHERLCKAPFEEYLFGSRLFGTHTEDSDFDYIRLYHFHDVFEGDSDLYLPNIHSFQFDDTENNTQYIWMTVRQFYTNLYSGDGTMQSDIVMFSGIFDDEQILELCRTYKIIKAYCGVAKRDLKLHGKILKKRFHAQRSLYIAETLMNGEIPVVEEIQRIAKDVKSMEELQEKQVYLRQEANRMFMDGELHNYNIPEVEDSLLQKMLDANNIREFKY